MHWTLLFLSTRNWIKKSNKRFESTRTQFCNWVVIIMLNELRIEVFSKLISSSRVLDFESSTRLDSWRFDFNFRNRKIESIFKVEIETWLENSTRIVKIINTLFALLLHQNNVIMHYSNALLIKLKLRLHKKSMICNENINIILLKFNISRK